MDWFPLVMSVVCPLVVAFPASAYSYSQKMKLESSLKRLAEAHEELEALHHRLVESARHDDMTGLLNRKAFIAEVDAVSARGLGGGMLLIDVDKFKDINDTHGHLAGDEALRAVAEVIVRCLNGTGIAGRLGGEEFGAFLPQASVQKVRSVAENVRRMVEEVESHPRATRKLTVSIGIAYSDACTGFSALMTVADQHLYEAKRDGRNRVAPLDGAVPKDLFSLSDIAPDGGKADQST